VFVPNDCPPLLTQAIQKGETWFIKEATPLTLNYEFIEMVMTAYCALPIAQYRLNNGGERAQENGVTTSHETVVALLAFKASKNGFGKPKQGKGPNIYQLNSYSSQKKIIEDNFPAFFPHQVGPNCDPSDVAFWCCNIKWVSHWFSRHRQDNSTSSFEADCPHKYYLGLLGFFEK
jgi:hypothetical protein